jgi:hypothetical protein
MPLQIEAAKDDDGSDDPNLSIRPMRVWTGATAMQR